LRDELTTEKIMEENQLTISARFSEQESQLMRLELMLGKLQGTWERSS